MSRDLDYVADNLAARLTLGYVEGIASVRPDKRFYGRACRADGPSALGSEERGSGRRPAPAVSL